MMTPVVGLPPLEPPRDAADYDAVFERTRALVADLHRVGLEHDQLPMWVVSGPDTTDQPGAFVARLWITRGPRREGTGGPTGHLLRAGTLDEIRALLPPGLTRFERDPSDPPNILETWL